VLQFSFGADRATRPYRWPERSVACTGTHDNETVAGWIAGGGEEARRALRYARASASEPPHWAMIRLVFQSASDLAVVPAQDLLGLGNDARMNVPGTPRGNWGWRLAEGALTPEIASRLRELSDAYDRLPPG
jgi:4-alpha-glucanotransferase